MDVEIKNAVGTVLAIAPAGAHTVYFNAADAWANDTGGDLTADITGTVVLSWRKLT